MKKIIVMCLSLCMLALLCACGETAEPTSQTPAIAQERTQEETLPEGVVETKEAAQEETAAQAAAESAEAPEEATEAAEAPAEPTALETALTFVDQDVSELVSAIGEPLETAYEASCSGPGDDGVWTYDGLTVFTYRENGVETVVDAE